jgi:CARDB
MEYPAFFKSSLLGLTALTGAITQSNAQAAPITWNGWSFDYTIGVNAEGLALKNVSYKGHTILKKISLPIIQNRDGSCSPTSIKIDGNLSPMPWASNATVSQRQFSQNGKLWYEIGIYKKTGVSEYFQAYYLSSDGIFDAHLFHRNGEYICFDKPFWRIDADVDGAMNDTFIFTPAPGTSFKNPALVEFDSIEFKLKDLPDPLLVDKQSQAKLYLRPGFNFNHPSGVTTIFNDIDRSTLRAPANMHTRVYKSAEDIGWSIPTGYDFYPYPDFGETYPAYQIESVVNQDVLFWYAPTLPYNSDHIMPDIGSFWVTEGFSLAYMNANDLPDLVVDSVNYANGVFSATIRNKGAASTPSGKWVGVGFYVDGVYKTWATVRSVAAGQSVTVTTQTAQNFQIPNGSHTYLAYVNDGRRFDELNHKNNSLANFVKVFNPAVPQPGIRITSLANNTNVSGTTVLLTAKVDNPSVSDGVMFHLQNLQGYSITNFGIFFQGQPITPSRKFPPYAFVWDSTTVPEGDYILTAIGNNLIGSDSILVHVKIPATITRPDIAVTSVDYVNGGFTSTIKNIGTAAIPAGALISTGYYVDNIFRNWTTTLDALAPGQTKTLGSSGTAYTIPTGSHTIKAYADDSYLIGGDTNRANNQLSKTINMP